MLPEVAWIVAIHRENVRGDFIFHEVYRLVKTVAIVKAKVVPKPDSDCLHCVIAVAIAFLSYEQFVAGFLGQLYLEGQVCAKFLHVGFLHKDFCVSARISRRNEKCVVSRIDNRVIPPICQAYGEL